MEPGDDRAAAARRPARRLGDVRGVLARRQRGERAQPHAPRAAHVQVRRGRRHPARGRRARGRDRQAVRDRRDVARLDLARGARDACDRDEPDRRQVEHRRGRRGSRPLPARCERRPAPLCDQAGRVGPVRREHQLPDERRRAADQDGAGREARRGWPAAGAQGRRLHRRRAADDAGRGPHLTAAAPRHLLDRGSEAADLRPALREPGRPHLRQARRRGGRRHGCRRGREGERRPRAHLGSRRRHRRLTALVDPLRGDPVGDRPRRDPADPRAERPALADLGADRRAAEDRPRRGRRRAARRGRDGVRNGAARRERLRDDARLPPEHVPGGDRDAGSRAAPPLQGPARARRQLLLLRRRGDPAHHGASSASRSSRISPAASTCSRPTRRSSTGRRAASTSPAYCRFRLLLPGRRCGAPRARSRRSPTRSTGS